MKAPTDESAIAELIYAYAEHLDGGDFAAVGALFSEADYGPAGGPYLTGAQAVEDIMRAVVIVYDDGTPRTKHATSNLVIDVDGATARARAYFSVFQQFPPDGPNSDEGAPIAAPIVPIVMGRYADTFIRDPKGWRFHQRQVSMDMVGDTRHHLR